jgi:hypothetical protein
MCSSGNGRRGDGKGEAIPPRERQSHMVYGCEVVGTITAVQLIKEELEASGGRELKLPSA